MVLPLLKEEITTRELQKSSVLHCTSDEDMPLLRANNTKKKKALASFGLHMHRIRPQYSSRSVRHYSHAPISSTTQTPPSFSSPPLQAAKLLDGRILADQVLSRLHQRIQRLRGIAGRPPCVAVLQVGSHPESEIYVGAKRRAAERVGIEFSHRRIPENGDASKALLREVEHANLDTKVDGVIVQLPLPPGLDADSAFRLIAPEKACIYFASSEIINS